MTNPVVRYTTLGPTRDPNVMPEVINEMAGMVGCKFMHDSPAEALEYEANNPMVRQDTKKVVYKVTFEKVETTE